VCNNFGPKLKPHVGRSAKKIDSSSVNISLEVHGLTYLCKNCTNEKGN
jgi:hypothetical protein